MVGRTTVFASGKLISVGTKSPEQAEKELRKSCRILEKYGLIKSRRIHPKLQNIVARYDLGHSVPIEKLARTLPRCIYEPEQFSALIFRIPVGCVALIFASGKGVLVGAKSVVELNTSFFELKKYLQ